MGGPGFCGRGAGFLRGFLTSTSDSSSLLLSFRGALPLPLRSSVSPSTSSASPSTLTTFALTTFALTTFSFFGFGGPLAFFAAGRFPVIPAGVVMLISESHLSYDPGSR